MPASYAAPIASAILPAAAQPPSFLAIFSNRAISAFRKAPNLFGSFGVPSLFQFLPSLAAFPSSSASFERSSSSCEFSLSAEAAAQASAFFGAMLRRCTCRDLGDSLHHFFEEPLQLEGARTADVRVYRNQRRSIVHGNAGFRSTLTEVDGAFRYRRTYHHRDVLRLEVQPQRGLLTRDQLPLLQMSLQVISQHRIGLHGLTGRLIDHDSSCMPGFCVFGPVHHFIARRSQHRSAIHRHIGRVGTEAVAVQAQRLGYVDRFRYPV